MTTREDLESYLIRLGADYDEVEEGLWALRPEEGGATVVVSHSPPVVLLRLKVMELPAGADDARLGRFYRRLLELNANDLVHGSYGLEDGVVVLSDAMELEGLDFVELQSSYESLVLAASTHPAQLTELVPSTTSA